jgi:hypothetical protein
MKIFEVVYFRGVTRFRGPRHGTVVQWGPLGRPFEGRPSAQKKQSRAACFPGLSGQGGFGRGSQPLPGELDCHLGSVEEAQSGEKVRV